MTDDPAPRPDRLETGDGERLEARWSLAPEARAVAVLTHPHPLYGGDMDNIVPASLARALPPASISTVRFNFRGTGTSTGRHGGGTDEVADVRAAIDAGGALGVPVVGVGYSFGADVLLATDHPALAAVIAVAPPLAVLPTAELAKPRSGAPTLVLSAEHDQFRAPVDAQSIVGDWPGTTFEILAGADHFLAGQSSTIADRVLAFLEAALH